MIYCIGESLYDIIFRNGQPEWAVPGGGMLNCAVSLGHAGANVQLISELGNDNVGSLIADFLKMSRVGTDYLRTSDNNSTLALAFLEENGDANYQFYVTQPDSAPDFTVPEFKRGDLLVFGSFYSIAKRNRSNVVKLAMAAKNAGAFILYDPNFRKSHLNELDDVYRFIIENISLADIVRGSDEDFRLIMKATGSDKIYDFVKGAGGNILLITRNIEGVDLFLTEGREHYDAIPVNVVSTIGAGDSFNAGIVFELDKLGRLPVDSDEWKMVISTGLNFAAEVCTLKENYIKVRW